MKVYKETSIKKLRDEDAFWSGGADFAATLTDDECRMLDGVLEETYPDGVDMTTLNDILRFDQDWVCEVIGRDPDEDED